MNPIELRKALLTDIISLFDNNEAMNDLYSYVKHLKSKPGFFPGSYPVKGSKYERPRPVVSKPASSTGHNTFSPDNVDLEIDTW
ncbi:MAG: hypothetical protein LKF31_11410 [Muribaculaceae bacterium]|jgi:hypothetical protein|nr:hypothetical protein [Muribaculaceae bacterium]